MKTLISTANVEIDVLSLQNDNSLITKEHRHQKKTAPDGLSRALCAISVKAQALPSRPHTWNPARLESF